MREKYITVTGMKYYYGCYYVFDGQHTISARVARNGGRDLPIRCKRRQLRLHSES
ncbi:MAG: hypothetical protein LUG93_16815 [Lachnospiraceae bacterium]|nr:hypothetical protein [Lachnospiraceae bacterium]